MRLRTSAEVVGSVLQSSSRTIRIARTGCAAHVSGRTTITVVSSGLPWVTAASISESAMATAGAWSGWIFGLIVNQLGCSGGLVVCGAGLLVVVGFHFLRLGVVPFKQFG